MSDECKCGFDHWPLPCRDEKPPNERAESSFAAPSGSPASREHIKKLGLAACYLRTAANFSEKGWLKESYMEAEHAQRLLKEVIEGKPENDQAQRRPDQNL